MSLEHKPLPRPDLLEPAFRSYEPYIVKCYLHGSYELNPREERTRSGGRQIQAYSWKKRCVDAILAFKLYNYPCINIPPGTDLSHIKVIQLEYGFILMKNLTKDAQKQMVTTTPQTTLQTSSTLDLKSLITWLDEADALHDTQTKLGQLYQPREQYRMIFFSTPEEERTLIELQERYYHCSFITIDPKSHRARFET